MTDWKLWIENTVREDGVPGWRPYERQRYLDGFNLDRGNYSEGTCIYSAALNFQGSDITTSLGKNNQMI